MTTDTQNPPPPNEAATLGAEVLHCYAQPWQHAEAYLSGSRGALMRLHAAIGHALASGSGACEVFSSDGEGYTLHVVAMSDADAERQAVPYTDEMAMQPIGPDTFGPWCAL